MCALHLNYRNIYVRRFSVLMVATTLVAVGCKLYAFPHLLPELLPDRLKTDPVGYVFGSGALATAEEQLAADQAAFADYEMRISELRARLDTEQVELDAAKQQQLAAEAAASEVEAARQRERLFRTGLKALKADWDDAYHATHQFHGGGRRS